ncbi:MAG: aconitate hydratase AcnA [bacterium]|nr:aconitate hydratase AcnA [bacterium]
MSAFGSEAALRTATGALRYYRLSRLEELGLGAVSRLPVSIKVLLEGALRYAEESLANGESPEGTAADVMALAAWAEPDTGGGSVAFRPGRMVLQDFTGIPALLGVAAVRSAVQRAGGDPERVDLNTPTDLVIDHSLQVDVAGAPGAHAANLALEYERNAERFGFARWAEQAFANLRVVPPGRGIVHQVNMEFLASVVSVDRAGGDAVVRPDTVVGTDSHTTMIGGLGVLGWGVGGIEAETVMLGEPIDLVVPEVVGVRLTGRPAAGVTATDLVLAVARALRDEGVVGAFVEFFGAGLDFLSLEDRATVANMAPEYGATIGYFAPDAETLHYLRRTARPPAHIDLVERYCKAQGLFRTPDDPAPAFSRVMPFDLGAVAATVAGPSRPTQTLTLREVPESLAAALAERGLAASTGAAGADSGEPGGAGPRPSGASATAGVRDGDVVIAAITSCTNTSNPAVMIGAGLLARNAVERGLATPSHVKTSLAPGSPVVADYLERSGLLRHLEKLGFAIVGFGCTTCAGGSGPLGAPVAAAVEHHDLSVAAVLSGNRNFEGRIHPQCRLGYLASPALVVAYALAGTVDIDLTSEPIALDADGVPVLLAELWPDDGEIRREVDQVLAPELFAARGEDIFSGDRRWLSQGGEPSVLPSWDPDSTYINEPPFCDTVTPEPLPTTDIRAARCLLLLGDAITTDHISPAGLIHPDSPAGRHLLERGVAPEQFNILGARRGNHDVMVRATFANPRLLNHLAGDREGGWTTHQPGGEVMAIYEAAERYRREATPLVVLAGSGYGAGSSRDWAAKGTALLGVRAVVAESFERLHRQNLVGMGVLPLEFASGQGWRSAGLDGTESYDITGLQGGPAPGGAAMLVAISTGGAERRFPLTVRLDSDAEATYWRHGGIVPFVVRRLLAEVGAGKR